jgi:hypothetical protein
MNNKLREFIISVMDNDDGISQKSFAILKSLAKQDKSLQDIVSCVDACDGRFFLSEEDAAMLKK